MNDRVDVAIVGGGIGGAALATVLARAGLAVLVLEQSTVYHDRVRGEWLAPWGLAELIELGLYDVVRAAGGHHVLRHQFCDEETTPEESALRAIDLSTLLPGVPGPLCIGHPMLCQLLIEEAARAGATVQRGVSEVQISPSERPRVTYRHGTAQRTVTCRLLVGADGRGSSVRHRAAIELHRDATHHLFAGLLIAGADGWPDDLQVIGTEDDVHFLAFPQGGGRVRLYLGYATDQARRFAGVQGPSAFLAAFRLRSVPGSEHLANARPAGPCASFPNEDTWTDRVAADGVLLIGDAAGSNDPILGQGLSITLRDVRSVRDALLGERAWSPRIFDGYAAERRERMRRLRFVAALVSTLQNEFGPAASRRRRRVIERQTQDPMMMLPLMATLIGPHNVPAEAFEPSVRDRLLGAE